MVTYASELKELDALYKEQGNQLVFIAGKRGSDKEQLLKSFMEGKKSFYYRCRECSPEKQLEYMKSEVSVKYSTALTKNSYDECFNRVKSGDSTKLVVVIDEIQFGLKGESALLSSLAKLKAKKLYPGPVMIVIATSSVVWAEKDFPEILAECAPKAITKTMILPEMSFLDIVRTFPEYSVSDSVAVYGIIGGVPSYVKRWNGKKSIKENIIENILSETGFLFNEAREYVSVELRELSVYNTIIASIASGNEKLNDLFLDTGYNRAKISVYMKNLAAFGVIDKVVSFETGGWDNAKKGVYSINSPFINFWFTFVYPHMSELYVMEPDVFYNMYIEPGLKKYLSTYFSKVCHEYMQLLNMVGKLPIKINRMGTWVGKEGTIDIIAQNSVRENVVGICNWSEPVMPKKAYDELVENMKRARITAKNIFLFSATTFDEQLKALAAGDTSVILVDMNEL